MKRRSIVALTAVGLAVAGLLPLGAASASATTEYTTCSAWVITSRTNAPGLITIHEQQSCYSWYWNIYGSNQILDRRWTNYKTIYAHAS